ncbi:MAG: aminotransferase class I/II-fold pyridoxal phosphate-dependent enzyme, partial [Armatimonadetes bacterium]|nr:aminotransferase class I/II-fold pyridoxal phosphate-dependent enzyme [Armatimonadota bacterium]
VRVLLRACGAVPVDAPMVDGKVSLESIAARVGPRTRVVVLANPNNPTGDAFTADALDALVRALPNEVALLLDEAHVDFSAPAYATVGRTLLEHHPGRRIAFVRSFSKARGLAGLRLGYGVGRVAEAAGLLGICSVNAVAQAAGMAALADARHLESVRQACAVSRAALDRLLRTHGWRPQRSEAGFVLAQFDGDAVAFAEALAEVGVRIRSMRDWGLPEGYARFAVGPRWTVTRLAEAMRQVSSR